MTGKTEGVNAVNADKRKADRHSPGYMRGYMREWQRKRRAKKKSEIATKSVDTSV